MPYQKKKIVTYQSGRVAKRSGATKRAGNASKTASKALTVYRRPYITRYPRTAPRANSWQPKVTSLPRSMPQYALANYNAFHPMAEGAKVPDMSCIPSATSFSRDVTTMAANGSGVSYWAFRAQPSATAINGTSLNGVSQNGYYYPTWPAGYGLGSGSTSFSNLQQGGTQDPCFANMVMNYQDVRTVAAAIRIQCTQAPNNATGFVHIAVVPEDFAYSTWSYPTAANTNNNNPATAGMAGSAFASMERAPYYQKIPVANLINNQVTVQLPIMDEGAYRYRNTAQLPGNSNQQVLTSTSASTGGGSTPVQITQVGSVALDATSGAATVTFGVPFVNSNPVVTATVQAANDSSVEDCTVTGTSLTGFSVSSDIDPGGSAGNGNFGGSVANWSATGYVTPANYALFMPDGTEALTVQNTQFSQINAIETTYGWSAVIVAIEGAIANQPCLEVESMRHYEGVPTSSGATIITASAAGAYSPMLTGATKYMQTSQGPFRQNAQNNSGATSAAAAALYDGAQMVAGCASPAAAMGMAALRPIVIGR